MTETPPPSPTVVLHIPRDKAERMSSSFSDLICWVHGFMAAGSLDDLSRDLLTPAINQISLLNADIKDAL